MSASFFFLICGMDGLCEEHNDKSHGFSFFCLILAVPFNVIVLGLGHMRATGDGVVHWDLQTNWTWFR